MARDEIRVNIIIKGDNIFMGAQAPGCDPKMTTLKGDITAACERLPVFIAEANTAWDVAPRNPASTVPEPVTVTPKSTTPRSTSSSSSKPAPETKQQAFF
jgi:hypothetical protein